MTRQLIVTLFFAVLGLNAQGAVVTLDKGGFKLTYDCTNRAATRYEYTLTKDTGSAARPSSFYLDPDLPSGCLGQLSTASYASVVSGWDRGHLVTSNHMDASTTYIKRANYMSNIVPQVSSFNQGIWVEAENVAECYRDLATVYVYGGLVYNDTSNDYFVSSHGIKTPDYFWKTVITTDATSGATKAISWYIPNKAGLSSLNSYIVSISELETKIGAANVGITATATVKAMKPTTTWATPSGCNLS
ncbi:MAG: DNA/RNA non-specific endonuclease [Pelomonas sp.]|nr:DNA/RNA non-specific endonuclease [Roseateles sp.]